MANDHAGDDLRRNAPLPPVSSHPGGGSGAGSGAGFGAPMNGDGRMAAPFVGAPTTSASLAQPAAAYSAGPEEEEIPWAQGPLDETGEVEPVFEADVSETEAALAALSLASRGEDFPLDAFIIPEHAQRIPNGFEGKPLPEERRHTPVTDLAERLEKLSHRLRVEEADAVVTRLAGGDKLDTLLAGLLAGYIAGSK